MDWGVETFLTNALTIFFHKGKMPLLNAEVAELVDALASGASGGNPVKVQVLSSAPII